MNKKFLSAVLFGALLASSTGTFVSCKDYDDDITELWDAVNGQKTDLTAKVTAVESSITSLTSAQSALETKISETKDAAEKAALAAQEAAIEAAKAELETVKAELQATIDGLKDDSEANKEAIANVEASITEVTGRISTIATAVTKVEEAAAALQTTVTTLESKVSSLEADVKDNATKIGELKSAIEAQQEALKEYAKSSDVAANASAIETLQNELAEQQKVLEKLDAFDVSATQTAIETLTSNLSTLSTKVDGLETKINTLTTTINALKGMVTSLDLQLTGDTNMDGLLELNYSRIDKDITFGKGLTGELQIKKGDVFTIADNVLASVAPVSAVVTPDMLSLINSQEVSLDDYVTFTVSNYDGLLTRAASNGLRKIGVQLKNDVDFEAFHNLVNVNYDQGKKKVLYALAITEEERTVASTYDLTLDVAAEEAAQSIPAHSYLKSSADIQRTWQRFLNGGDNTSSDENSYPVVLGESFKITVGSDYANGNGGRIMASYVVVDKNNASLSNTDKAAIESFTFEGVDAVSTENAFDITINGSVPGVVIPLKIYTIDYLGNQADYTVWVKAGKSETAEIALTVTPNAYVATPTAYIATSDVQPFTIPANAAKYVVSLVAGEETHSNCSKFNTNTWGTNISNWSALSLSGATLKLWQDANGTNAATKLSNVAYASFNGALNLQAMRENKAYVGVIKFYDSQMTYLGDRTIQLTKVLPEVVPAGFDAKTNAIDANGVLSIYPTPVSGTDKGVFDLNKAFNNWNDAYYILTIDKANVTYNAANATITNISNGIINNGQTYASTIEYNYGQIEYQPEGTGTAAVEDYKVTWSTSFSTKFGCLPYDSKYTWNQEPVVYYGEDAVLTGVVTKANNGTVTNFTDVIKVTDPYGKVISPFASANDAGWTTWAPAWDATTTIKLITNNDRVNEFFTAKFGTKKEGTFTKGTIELSKNPSTEVVLSGDVVTKVVVVTTDLFGHSHEIEIGQFTMKKDHQ